MGEDESRGARRSVTDDEYREVLRQLLVGWRTMQRAAPSYNVLAEHQAAFGVCYGWIAETHAFGKAYLALESRGCASQGSPIVRAALEYALSAHTVHLLGEDGFRAIYKKHTQTLKQIHDTAKEAHRGFIKPEDLAGLLDPDAPDVPQASWVHRVEQVCRRLGIMELYVSYRVACQMTHPTWVSANQYLMPGDSWPPKVLNERDDTSAGAVGMMAHSVLWARRTLDDMLRGHPYREWLDRLAKMGDIAPRLPPG
ncbi:MAG: hypothetical protein ACTHQ3_08570 [Motilibacteraceae bacterium]